MRDTTQFTGPDFIGQLAECQLQNGLEVDAAALRNNAQAWRKDRETIDNLRNLLQNAEDRLSNARHALVGQ